LYKLICLFLFIFITNISLAEDSFNIINTKLKKGDTFYKVFSEMDINKKDSKLFISSLQRKLDLKRMPTGQEIKFYFIKNTRSLIAVAVPIKKDITVLTFKNRKKIVTTRLNDDLLNDRINSIIYPEEFKPKPGIYRIIVNKGDNLTKLLSNAAVNIEEIQNLIQAISEEVDLRQLRPNDLIELFYVADAEGVSFNKIKLYMFSKIYEFKKDSFNVFRFHKNIEIVESIETQNIELDKQEINKENLILGQLIEEGWSKKEAREAVDAFSTVYDPKNINIKTEMTLPKDINIKAFAIQIENNFSVLVQKIKNGNFLAQRVESQKANDIILNLKLIKQKELVIEKKSDQDINALVLDKKQTDNLYFKTNLIEGKISEGDTLINRLLALGEKKVTIIKALKTLSKKMNPNLVRSGSSLIVALDKREKPMKGFFIEIKSNKGYLIIIKNDDYIVKNSTINIARNELAKLVKPNLEKRKVDRIIIPEWKTTSLVKPFKNNVKIFTFKSGETLSHAFSDIGVSEKEVFGFINKLKNEFDPRKLKVGNKLKFYLSKKDPKIIEGISLQLDKIRSIEVFKIESDYILNKYKEPIVITFHKVSGEINNSLYVSAKKAGLPISVLMEVVKIYSFDVDFQREIKAGDAFEVLYQIHNNKSGETIRSGPVLRSVLVLGGERIPLYRYEYEKDYFEYFDSEANSAKKALMRTPLDGARISSVFGKRKHPILGYTKMHKGVDFAAPRNTPVYAAGDGVIEYSRSNGGYGKFIRIRHNSDYKTAYAHLARFAKNISEGKRVKQGDIIGYVGTTGRSTGPHLHYEIIFRDKQVNPLKVRMPKELKLKNQDFKSFIIERNRLDNIWDSL